MMVDDGALCRLAKLSLDTARTRHMPSVCARRPLEARRPHRGGGHSQHPSRRDFIVSCAAVLHLAGSSRPPRCVFTGPVVVRLAEMANERERESGRKRDSSSVGIFADETRSNAGAITGPEDAG